MKSPVVRLKIRVRLPDGSRPFLDPVFSANGKLKPLYAVVDGKPEHHPEGSYVLRYAGTDGKRVWEIIGNDPQVALAKRHKQEKTLHAKAAGVKVVEDAPASKRTPLANAIADYLHEVKQAKAERTYRAYSLALRLFTAVVKREHLEEINREDLLVFVASLKDAGQKPRTVANRVAYVKSFFKHYECKLPLKKTDRIRYTEKAVSAYNAEELKSLFAAADWEEFELFQFFLMTGARDQEVQYAAWPDLNFPRKTFTVTEKLDLGFTPKDKEEGSIPLPDDFVDLMKARQRRSKTRLIFPAADGGRERHFLRILQRLAFRAGLNCGQCYDKQGRCCATRANCKKWGLHRFRKTFATLHHEAGVSARTIQRWLRHSSLDTTLRYLAGSDDQSQTTRVLVNSTFAAIGGDR